MPFVALFICSFSTRGKEEETGRGAGGGSRRGFCRAGKRRRNRKKQRVVDRRGGERGRGGGGGDHVEEPSCDNRPTSMHRCKCHECTLASPATLPLFRTSKSNFIQTFTEAIQFFLQHFFFFFTAITCFATHFQIISMLHVWLPQISFGWCENVIFLFFFLYQAVILPTRQQTTYCTLTDRKTYRQTNIQNRY